MVVLATVVPTVALILIFGITVYCKRKPTSGGTPRVKKMTKAPTIKHNPFFQETDPSDGSSMHLYDEIEDYLILLNPNPAYRETPRANKREEHDDCEEETSEASSDYVQLRQD